MKRLGLDIGSLYLGAVLLEEGRILASAYREMRGDTPGALREVVATVAPDGFDVVGVTGQIGGSRQVLDSTLAVTRGASWLLPGCRNVISVGGQSYLLLFFDEEGGYREHVPNPPCAAGTGSFLDQQAERLGLDARALSEMAGSYTGKVPSIATRCAVFAKSDIIHGMQEGYGVEAICAGLCEGLGRSIVDSLVKGRALASPVGIVGGVAQNAKVVEAIGRALKIPIVVPELPWAAGAIGAALLGTERDLDRALATQGGRESRKKRPCLELQLSHYPTFETPEIVDGVEVTLDPSLAASTEEALALGWDIGSTSTKAAVVGKDGGVLAGFYTATRGEPIQAVQTILRVMRQRMASALPRVAFTGTTGSGRSMIREVFRADMEVNEITAHGRAAALLYPEVDTVIEIGGQDSKFSQMKDGEVVFSTMNYVCAAGTGSFIEEQAKRLGVSLADCSRLALGQSAPYTSDRCTVYMERDLNTLLGEGWSREAVLAAVLFSVRDNYLAKVVNRHRIGKHVVFQGATARNKALVAAFEQHLGQTVHVSPYCHLAGAIGVAVLSRESATETHGAFRFDDVDMTIQSEVCTACTNRCALTVVRSGDTVTGWGMKCGREYAERKRKRDPKPSLAEVRWGGEGLAAPDGEVVGRARVGVPDALYHKEYAILWRDWLTHLGFEVKVSSQSRRLLKEGRSLVNSDFCAPMILAHGAVKQLLDSNVEAVFWPTVLSADEACCHKDEPFRAKQTDSYVCYYSQYAPTIVNNLPGLDPAGRLVSPVVSLRSTPPEELGRTLATALAEKFPWLDVEQATREFVQAWGRWEARRKSLVARRPAPAAGQLDVVVVGRPYVVFDQAISLGILEVLERLGVNVVWQDEIPEGDPEAAVAPHLMEKMHWHYGKKILAAAEHVARTPGSFLVYLTCFRCSPDAFLVSYAKEIMDACGKPMLVLQLDEHGSDVGYTTRIEAALRTFRTHDRARRGRSLPIVQREPHREGKLARGDTVLVPYIGRLVSLFWTESFRQEGYDARMLDNDERVLHAGYRVANGGECMPAVAIAGGVIRKMEEQRLRPDATTLYLPTVCMACNFPQFPVMVDLAVRAAGVQGLKVPSVNFLSPSDVLPGMLGMKLFETSIVAGLLYKLVHRVRPYEATPGATNQALRAAEELVCSAIREKQGLRKTFAGVVDLFQQIERVPDAPRKPRVGVLGDLYVKYNEVVNQGITGFIEELGGEVVMPSMSDMTSHFLDVDVRSGFERRQVLSTLRSFEGRYERMAADLLGDDTEPPWEECVELMERRGLPATIAGETSMNVGRALHLLAHGKVEALVHLNPMFCCPGVVTSSLFRKIQEEFKVPIVDIFYDGTGEPNRVLVPHLTHLGAVKGHPPLG